MVTAPARFRQSDLERIFKAAKKTNVLVAAMILPTGEIEARMLTCSDGAAEEESPLRRRVFGGKAS